MSGWAHGRYIRLHKAGTREDWHGPFSHPHQQANTFVSVELLGIHPGIGQDLHWPGRHIRCFVQAGPKGVDEEVTSALGSVKVLHGNVR